MERKMAKRSNHLCLILLGAVLPGVPLHAQDSPSPPRSQEQGAPARFRSQVDEVVLYVSVYDKEGLLVSDLNKEDFRVYEDRVLQEVEYFGLDDVPTTIGLVMDKSGSMRPNVDKVNQAAELFLSLAHPENQLFLITFDEEVELEEDFTRDVEDIRDALENLLVGGGTALYDAIHLAVDQAREGEEPKRVLLVFTDGEDKDSYYSAEELLDKIQEAEVQVYLVAFLDEELDDDSGFFGVFKSAREKVVNTMTRIAEDTGGKAFFPEKVGELDRIFRTIAFELRNQYRLAYVSSNTKADGQWRPLKVEVATAKERGLRVRARKGYFARNASSSN